MTPTRIPSDHPAPHCNSIAHRLGKLIIKVSGWSVAGEVPKSRSMIVIAAPHTSNWDAFFLLGAAYSFGLSIKWLVKNSVFLPILGTIVKFLGGVPVDRSKPGNLVEQLANRITASGGMALVVPPAGTRGYTDYWKSGFYHIALAADIPIVCGYLDYPNKTAGLGLSFKLSGDPKQDMDRIRAFYEPIVGRYPEMKSKIILKEELEAPLKAGNS